MGHTMSIHSRNDEVILQFGLKKPAYRIVVNSPTTHGSIGLTTGLDPSMTLGCGGYGGNITSDNISPRHLLNIKRVAYEVTPAVVRAPSPPELPKPSPSLPKAPEAARPGVGLAADSLARRIDHFLASRGYNPPLPATASPAQQVDSPAPVAKPDEVRMAAPVVEKPAEFVCEEDVRQALKQGHKIVIGEKTIVTPAARDMAEQHRVFVQAGWRT
jgi:acetaldehyde dehydrogenase (acetylating)